MGNQTGLDNIWEKLKRSIKIILIEYINLGINIFDKTPEKYKWTMYQYKKSNGQK